MCSIQQIIQVVGYQVQHTVGVGGAVDDQIVARTLTIAVRQCNDGRRSLLLYLQIVISNANDAICEGRNLMSLSR